MGCIFRWAALLIATATLVVAYPQEKRQNACSNPVRRRSWTKLSNQEKKSWINAIKCLQTKPASHGINGAQNVWDEIQFAHIRNLNFIHGVGAFLPWHRYYITAFEKLMHQCGYQGGVPYWEEVVDVNNLASSPVWDATYGMGGDGKGANNCVTTGPFSNLKLRFMGDATVGQPYCLARKFNQKSFQGAAQVNIDECMRSPDWAGASGCWENLVHVAGHDGVGEVMADALRAPGDPIFFLHHTNLDRLWHLWQRAHPDIALTQMNRPNTPSEAFNAQNGWTTPGPEFTNYDGDNEGETTLNHVLWLAGIMPNATIADVMDLRGGLVCAEYEAP